MISVNTTEKRFNEKPTVQTFFKAVTLTWNKRLLIDVNNYRHLTNDFIYDVSETDKPTLFD